MEKLSTSQRQTFLSLLDDPSAPVRKALAARFAELGLPAHQFLQDVAQGDQRELATHAAAYLTELNFSDPVSDFRSFIRSLNYELESGSLLLARTVNRELDIAKCRRTLDQIAGRCRELIVEPSSPREKCRIINRVLFHEWGFRGNVEHYTDPRNSLLDRVLTRRKGLPITLSIVYLMVAERLGLDLEPIGIPGHFVVGCFLENEPFFIDPFDRGVFRDADELFEVLAARKIEPQIHHIAPTPVREVLCRCCHNLVNHYQQDGQPGNARLFASFVAEFDATFQRNSS